jgi:TRAP-type C4-dicarboxylate transport system substrate-binding protein
MTNGPLRFLFSSSILALLSVATFAQDSLTLRFGTHNAAGSPGVVEGAEFFMAAVEAATPGLSFEFYPSEQAGKALQMFDLVKAGAVDIGFISTGYTSSDKLVLLGTWEVPGLTKSSCDVAKAMNVLGEPGGLIYENDFKPNGLRVLAYLAYPPYGPAVSRNAITAVEDLQGLKMRNAGGLMELTVQAVGGAPVKMPSPEIYQSLQRGTLDAVLLSYLSVKSLDLASVGPFGTTGYSFGTPGDLIAISEVKFQSLSAEQQQALLEAGRQTSDHWCHHVDTTEARTIEELRANGMEIYDWSDADIARLNELTANIPAEWAAKLDERGKPGTEVLEAFRAAIAN